MKSSSIDNGHEVASRNAVGARDYAAGKRHGTSEVRTKPTEPLYVMTIAGTGYLVEQITDHRPAEMK